MDTAKIRKIPSLCKSEFVNKAQIGSHARGAVRVIRRTELPISCAGRGIATGDTVAAGSPCPSHRIAHRDVYCARIERKRPTRCHRHIDNRAGCRGNTAHRRLAVLIDNAQGWRALSAGHACALFTRFSPHHESYRHDRGDPEN